MVDAYVAKSVFDTERSVVDALVNVLVPLQVLLFARSVEDAAEMVYVPPRPIAVPLTVMALDVETSLPVASVERSELVRPVNQVLPEIVASEVEALEKLLRPVQVLLFDKSVVDAPVKVCCVFQKSAEVVENAAPWFCERKYEDEVVDQRFCVESQ